MFDEIVESNTAGSAMKEKVRWTTLKTAAVVKLFGEKGVETTRFIVHQLTKMKGFVKRKMSKTMTIKEVKKRDEQFHQITQTVAEFKQKGLPILSVDTKKKEFIGQFYHEGKSYCQDQRAVYDDDFPSLAEGVVVAHGIYHGQKNKGYLGLGKSPDTAEFWCDNLRY